jgi:hypothetical protein
MTPDRRLAAVEQTPTQAAAAEQAVRQAAFQRARRKLAAARRGEQAVFVPPPVSAWRRAGSILWAAFILVLVALMIWTDSRVLQPAHWHEQPLLPVALGTTLLLVLVFAVLGVPRRRLHPAERALHEFYGTASIDKKVSGLADNVVSADLDRSARRPPAFDCGVPQAPRIDSPEELDRYWNTLLKPDGKPCHSLSVKNVQLTSLADDVVLAKFRLRVMKSRVDFVLMAVVVVGLTGVMLAQEALEQPWSAIAITTIFFAGLCLLAFAGQGEHASFRVRKLLVHSGGKWRLFCGDWEGWEETDLSWLDEQDPRAVCEASVA